jgi:ubiquinone/menaquinone biosynthesis C-methylase UbiE
MGAGRALLSLPSTGFGEARPGHGVDYGSQSMTPTDALPNEALEHYASGVERTRLASGPGLVQRERTREIVSRHLPPPPAVVLDVGGGPGVYATWLAAKGFDVHLVDAVPLHVQRAVEASAGQPHSALKSAVIGDARSLHWSNASVDVVLLLGPLYHLTKRVDRLKVLREAGRVLRPGGVVLASEKAAKVGGLSAETRRWQRRSW